MDQVNEKAARFRALHERPGAFVIPNPWDVGSARLLAALGFEALATTSAGFAQALGRVDGTVTRDEKLAHCRALAAATELPVAADLENGFADRPEDVAETIRRAGETGIVGGSIEDYRGGDDAGIYELSLAVERVAAAVEAARELPFRFTLTARAENLLRGTDDLDDTIRRLVAYAEAGADVVYAPALRTREQVAAVVVAVDRPVNVLATYVPDLTVADLAALGVKRISVGSAMANAAIGALVRAGEETLQDGTFGWLRHVATGARIRELLAP